MIISWYFIHGQSVMACHSKHWASLASHGKCSGNSGLWDCIVLNIWVSSNFRLLARRFKKQNSKNIRPSPYYLSANPIAHAPLGLQWYYRIKEHTFNFEVWYYKNITHSAPVIIIIELMRSFSLFLLRVSAFYLCCLILASNYEDERTWRDESRGVPR